MVNCNPPLNNNLDMSPNLNVLVLVKQFILIRIKSKVGITFQKYQGKDQAYG